MADKIKIERIQTGVRIEKRILKVLKGLAEYLDMSLGDLIEGVVLHAFEGKDPFSDRIRNKIKDLKNVYELDLDSSHSHKLIEKD
jgi:predicted DNA-binding ribbon-helix-helix protein